MANQAKLHSFHTAPKFKCGFGIPRDYKHTMALDKKNKTTCWADATKLELKLFQQFDTFKDMDHNSSCSPLATRRSESTWSVMSNMMVNTTHTLLADGHLTDIPVDSVYSRVLSLHGFKLLVFLAELNGIEPWATDIRSACLQAETKEKVCICAGPDIWPSPRPPPDYSQGISYGLQSSGLRWHEKFC